MDQPIDNENFVDEIEINVNGQIQQFKTGGTIRDLLQHLKTGPAVAVEVEGELIPREQHGSFQLRSGISLEIVTLAGGG